MSWLWSFITVSLISLEGTGTGGQVCRMVCADWWWWLDLVPWTTLDHHPPPHLAQRHLCSMQPWPLVNIHPRSFHHSHTPLPLLVGHQLPCKINKFRNSSPLPSIYFNFNYYPSYETPVLGWSCIFTVPFLHFFRIPLTCWFCICIIFVVFKCTYVHA